MNFITASNAYCLYPYSTFCTQTTLVCGPTTRKIDKALEKYTKRGWSPRKFLDISTLTNHAISEWQIRSRRIGDERCWKRRLYPLLKDEIDDEYTLGINLKWRLDYNMFSIRSGHPWNQRPVDWVFMPRLRVKLSEE
jgi:hypothetical protein